MADVSKITYGSNTWDIKDSYARNKLVYPVVGTQTASTSSWTGNIDAPALYNGMTIEYWLPYAGSGNATLNLTLSGGGTTGAIPIYYTGNSRLTTHRPANSLITMTYWTAGSIKVSGTATTDNRWVVDSQYDTNTNNQCAYCTTAAATQAKTATFTYYYDIAAGMYFPIVFQYANTYSGVVTLNVNSTGAKNIYINGVVTSSSNKTIGRGLYWVYYDGSYYYINSDHTKPNRANVTKVSGSLTVAGWSSNSQSVTVSGVTASNDIFVSPAPGSAAAWAAAGIVCTAQAANSLTFTCLKTPTAALSFNVLIMRTY